MRFYHDTAKIQHGANTKDIDIDYQKEIIVGKFVDKDKPDFFTNRDNFLKNKLKATIKDEYGCEEVLYYTKKITNIK